MLPRACRSVAALSMMMGLAAASHASDWGTVPAISSTMGVHDGRVCVGEATRGDIGCPTYAPEVGTDGSISASRFVGDGSGLTGVVASTADRIVSGTTSLLAVSGTGFVSLTQAGTNTGWFDPTRGLVTLGVSATGRISATDLSVRGTIDIVSGLNVLIGQSAGTSGTGDLRTALGLSAGRFSRGSHVTFLGHSSGQYNVAGFVVGVGGYAAQYNTGSYGAALGHSAMEYNAGTYVAALGHAASRYNSSTFVTAVGSYAATFNTGSGTVAIGSYAATSNLGISTTAVGAFAGNANAHANVTLLGYNAQADKANQVVLGDSNIVEVSTAGVILARGVSTTGTVTATRFVGDGSGLTGLNASTDRLVSGSAALILSPTGVLNLTGRLELNSGTGVVGIGRNAVPNSMGDYVIGIGWGAGQYTSGSYATLVGGLAGQYNSSSYVTGLGYSAARYNSGTYITAVGNSAGYANNSIASSFLGYSAGERNTGSSYVTALGYYAGQSNSGAYLTAVGASAAWYNAGNVVNALGYSAARNNTGSYVDAIGHMAAISNTGSNVVAAGFYAAQNNTGSHVVAIGRDAAKANTFSNVVALGYNAQPDKANQIVLGDSSIVEVSTAGVILARGVSATGTVTATRFVGDGSGLTGLNASTDRLVSGSAALILSPTGVLNLTGRLELNSGTGVVGIGRNAAASSKGDYVVGIGTSAAQNNSGTYVTAFGQEATQNNSENNVNAIGYRAAQNNSGSYLNAIGSGAAQYNSGTNVNAVGSAAARFNSGTLVNALGYYAAYRNSGGNVNALGNNAAYQNAGSYVNALGMGSAYNNSGTDVNAVGRDAARNNTGSYVNAMGLSSAYNNSGTAVNAFGQNAAQYNRNNYVNAFGTSAAEYNSGTYVNAIGLYAAQYSIPDYVNAIGRETARYNTGAHVDALGYNAAISNTGSNVVAVGREAAKANTFSNVVALGYNAQPDKANQVVLGNASIVEVSTAGVIMASGVSTTGTVTATRFVGDGSGLTGVVASTADRIVSGTTSMVAVSSTGFVSLTQAGTNTGWFDPTRGLVTLGVSATGTVSGTKAYFNGNVGIGTVAPSSYALIVSGSAVGIGGVGLRMFGGDPADSNLTKLSFHPSNFSATSQYWAGILYSNANGWMSIGGGGGNVLNLYFDSGDGSSHIFRKVGWNGSARTSSEAMRLDGASNLGIGTSTPKARLHVAGAALVTSWTGINFSSANVTPTAPLEVSGTVSATYVKLADNDNLPCTAASNGTLRFSNGIVSICRAQ